MIDRSQTPTIHAALLDAEEALSRLDDTISASEEIECIRRIARAEQITLAAYNESHALIVNQIKDNLDLLNTHFGPLVDKAQGYSKKVKDLLRENVEDDQLSFRDGKWLLISYTKPTIRLASKDALRGYLIAHPEASELVVDVPGGTRITRWRLDLLD